MIGEPMRWSGDLTAQVIDFGDDRRFGILVERPEAGPVRPAPLILERHGEAPAQYGEEWDD